MPQLDLVQLDSRRIRCRFLVRMHSDSFLRVVDKRARVVVFVVVIICVAIVVVVVSNTVVVIIVVVVVIGVAIEQERRLVDLVARVERDHFGRRGCDRLF